MAAPGPEDKLSLAEVTLATYDSYGAEMQRTVRKEMRLVWAKTHLLARKKIQTAYDRRDDWISTSVQDIVLSEAIQ